MESPFSRARSILQDILASLNRKPERRQTRQLGPRLLRFEPLQQRLLRAITVWLDTSEFADRLNEGAADLNTRDGTSIPNFTAGEVTTITTQIIASSTHAVTILRGNRSDFSSHEPTGTPPNR